MPTRTETWGETYNIDPWSNLFRISAYTGKPQPETLNQTPGANNQFVGMSYDAAGNLLNDGASNYVFDGENRITTGAGVTYVYDGDGRRVKKSSGKLYWYGLGSDALDETDLAGNTNNSSFNEYIFFGGKRIARRDYQNNVNYYFSDHLGSSRIVASSSGSVLDDSDFYPFGVERVVTSSSGNRYKFTGKERDSESSLDNFGARFNASTLGRFMSADPSGISALRSNPQSWNQYTYTLNNPLRFVDPNGMWSTEIHNRIIDKAFKGRLSEAQIAIIKKASAGVDHDLRTQTNSAAFIHGMKAPGQTDKEAKALADNRTRGLAAAASAETGKTTGFGNTGAGVNALGSKALDLFGQGAHTIMDETSPAHRDAAGNPMVWDIKPSSPDAAGIAVVIAGIKVHEQAESTITDQQLADAAQALRQYFANAFGLVLTDEAIKKILEADPELQPSHSLGGSAPGMGACAKPACKQ